MFTVAACDEASVELRDAATGQEYHVHEHDAESGYQPGFVALGRLLSLDGERWLRSPGMALVSAPERGTGADLARGLAAMRETMGDALTEEALVASRDVGEWMQALSEQADIGSLGPSEH